MIKLTFTILMFLAISSFARATDVYQTNEQFLAQTFNGNAPKANVMWLNAEDKETISSIMSRKFNKLRIRYWQQNDKTAWIIDEIGKEKPITIGVHIEQNKIINLSVLAFRESRGDEVRHQFFTKQFINAQIDEENQLNQNIDGITGATMSVRALKKVARLTLWLDSKTKPKLAKS
ncbi:FMN-binding protein [Thalassotalea crassostreae]|uniref:FMN-binding protein n=1 Tax=Thalassotalea crassostreae TaxID=1763536 RepID=UPI00083987CD|nr:FMN-binding protein [Thalassotalea crassostreae]